MPDVAIYYLQGVVRITSEEDNKYTHLIDQGKGDYVAKIFISHAKDLIESASFHE